jgi:hypothetical protein
MLVYNAIEAHQAFRFPSAYGALMTKVSILKKDGTASRYFWNAADGETPQKTVYKQTPDGVKRMKGVHFNAATKRIVKH